MTIYKCKMCGGDLEIIEGATTAECEYCGTKQTVPKAMDENLQNLFNRANTLRIKSEFDKAEKLYEKIIEADAKQSEAYWGLILCKYGIEYVDDPATYKKVPTCHRASYASIIADDDYKSALEHADMSQRAIYEEQAKEIDRIQKDILALAQNEEAYDVFICYKETDADGRRTQDSVIANDIYYQLTNEGYKVFYAAITLEGKLGSAYEPIIFAALNSAKVMLSIGTKPEYFNAVWVKNEWSRFLKIIKNDRSKLLIPCYRDMDAYELPEEFAHLQAQDMSKIGFINDVVRGIKKVIVKEKPKEAGVKETVVKETVIQSGDANNNPAPLLKRVFVFLEDGDWTSADEYCEKVLDIDPENAQAYLGKMMAQLRVKTKEALKDCEEPLYFNNNYKKILRYADKNLKNTLNRYNEYINTRNENKRLENIYNDALQIMNASHTERRYIEAAKKFESIMTYRDSAELAKTCYEKAKSHCFKTEFEKMIIAGQHIICGVKTDGTVVAVGDNEYGQCNVETWRDIVAVCAGYYHTVGLKVDGTVVAVGKNDVGQCNVETWRDIVAVYAGNYHTVGLKADGTVVAVGENKYEQCNVETWRDIVDICAAGSSTIGLKADGKVVAVGLSTHHVGDWRWWNTVAVCSGSTHTIGLKADGKVIAEGIGIFDYGQGRVETWRDIVAVCTGDDHTVGLKEDGTVVAVGKNDDGQCNVKTWRDIVAVCAGNDHTVGLKADGTVVAVGYCYTKDFEYIETWRDIVAVYAGGRCTVGLKADGTVVAAGTIGEACNAENWKLFYDSDNLEEERKTMRQKRSEADAEERRRQEELCKKLEELRKKTEPLELEKNSLQSELASLGLFAFGRKRKIKERLLEIDQLLIKLKS